MQAKRNTNADLSGWTPVKVPKHSCASCGAATWRQRGVLLSTRTMQRVFGATRGTVAKLWLCESCQSLSHGVIEARVAARYCRQLELFPNR